MIWIFNNYCCFCVFVCSAGWSRWCLGIYFSSYFLLSLHHQTCSHSSVFSSRPTFFLFSELVPVCPESLSLSLQHHFLSSSFFLPLALLALSLCHLPPVADVSWCERWSHREECSWTVLSLFKKPGHPGGGRRNVIECSSDTRNETSLVTDVDPDNFYLLESFFES